MGGEDAGFSDSSEDLSAGSSEAVGATPCGCPDLDLHSYFELHFHSNLCKIKIPNCKVVPLVKNLPPNAGDARDAGSIPNWEDLLEYEWQPTSVVLPEKFHGQESLADYS